MKHHLPFSMTSPTKTPTCRRIALWLAWGLGMLAWMSAQAAPQPSAAQPPPPQPSAAQPSTDNAPRETPAEESEKKGPPPNIVLIFVDDLGWGDLGSYGQTRIRTPRLDRMAAEGMRLTDFYAGDAWCPASRNALMSGQHAGHTQLRGPGVLKEDSAQVPLYLPRMLKNAGYATGMFGKWGLGGYATDKDGKTKATGGRPSQLGFDEFLGQMNHRDAHTFTLPPYPQKRGDTPIHPKLWTTKDGETVEHEREQIPYVPDVTLEAALDFIDRHQKQPFFLYLPSSLPHAEYYLPADKPAWRHYLDVDGRSIFPEKPWAGGASFRRPVAKPRAAFAAMITHLDSEVGRILDVLERRELDKNTVVFFISDNGPAEDGGFESPLFFNSTGGLRDFKLGLYEGGIRVPMIAHWPGKIPSGESSIPMALWDLFPTVLDLARIPRPTWLDGLSMLPMLLGKGDEQPRHDIKSPLYWETFNWIFHSQAARIGRWKAVRPYLFDSRDVVELYDLAQDPGEYEDVAHLAQHCATLIKLKRVMNDAHTAPPVDADGKFDIPPLELSCAHLFSDGFETGDMSFWTARSGEAPGTP